MTALFIACKFQEIEVPHMKNMVDITDNSYTERELVECEGQVLNALNFRIAVPNRLDFLLIYQKETAMSQKQLFMSQYLLELSLVDSRMKNFS